MKADPKPLEAFLIEYSDSDFTNPHEVVLPDEPKDCRGDFTHMGAKYWGIESRRHKATCVLPDEQALAYDHDTHNWLQIGLKERCEINKITISTKWYTANQVRAVSVCLIDDVTGQKERVLERQPLNPDAEHEFEITPTIATECLIECYYDGGISRINFFGTQTEEQLPERRNLLEGAKISHISNDHYGNPEDTVKSNRKEMHMVGWESARTGFGERALFHLKQPSTIDEIIVDTYLHRLNAPLTCHVFGVHDTEEKIDNLIEEVPRWKLIFDDGTKIIPDDFQSYMLEQKYLEEKDTRKFRIALHQADDSPWQSILPFAPLRPDTYHRFREFEALDPVTHILYMHYPNGGIHGLKMYGAEQ